MPPAPSQQNRSLLLSKPKTSLQRPHPCHAARLLICALFCCLFTLLMHLGTDDEPLLSSAAEPADVSSVQSAQSSAQSSAHFAASDSGHPMVIAYAISLVKCGDHQSTASGLTDAAIVLRHSVHLTSVRNPASTSKYDYKMYALVHKDAEGCSGVLKDVGFQVVLVDPPVSQEQIRGDFLRKNIHREWCCGSDEFIKLYAYNLPHPVIVHVDIDFAFYKPMDDLFDAIIHDKESHVGKLARSKLVRERPTDTLPDKIDAMFTRDWPQVVPGRKAMFQAGFLVARHDPTVVDDVKEIILEGNYTEGFQIANGWAAAGYGGYVGSMAMQGLMAYFYDMIRPGTFVELNQCRFNHMGMDVRYRHAPNFMKKKKKIIGNCRNDNAEDVCEDCMTTDIELIYNVHYTQCRKPWNCIGQGSPGGRIFKAADSIDTNAGNFEHCMRLIKKWHATRSDFEDQLYDLTKDVSILQGRNGTHMPQYFSGHCAGEGGSNYQPIQGSSSSWMRVMEIYAE